MAPLQMVLLLWAFSILIVGHVSSSQSNGTYPLSHGSSRFLLQSSFPSCRPSTRPSQMWSSTAQPSSSTTLVSTQFPTSRETLSPSSRPSGSPSALPSSVPTSRPTQDFSSLRIKKAQLTDNGSSITIAFNGITSRGSLPQYFDCSLCFATDQSLLQLRLCHWLDSSNVEAWLSPRSSAAVGQSIGFTLDCSIRLCNTSSCSISAPTVDWSTVLAPASPKVIPAVHLQISTTKVRPSTCGYVGIDISTSEGSGGYPWLSSTWNVSATDSDGQHTLGSTISERNLETTLSNAHSYASEFFISNSNFASGYRYVLSITMCNLLQQCNSKSAEIAAVDEDPNLSVPIVRIDGSRNMSVYLSDNLIVSASARGRLCHSFVNSADGNSDISFAWFLNGHELQTYSTSASRLQRSVLSLFPSGLTALSVTRSLEVRAILFNNRSAFASDIVHVEFIRSPLVVVLTPALLGTTSLAVGESISLNASASYDPDAVLIKSSTKLSFSWTFGPGCNGSYSQLLVRKAFARISLVGSGGSGKHCTVHLAVRDASNSVGNARVSYSTVELYFARHSEPNVQLVLPAAEQFNFRTDGRAVVDGDRDLSVLARIEFEDISNRTCKWALNFSSSTELIAIDSQQSYFELAANWGLLNLVVFVTRLQWPSSFQLQLQCLDDYRVMMTSVVINSPPFVRYIRILPAKGMALETNFEIDCAEAVDEDLPIYYQFFIQSANTATRFPLGDKGFRKNVNSFLPQMSSGNLTVGVEACDALDSCSTLESSVLLSSAASELTTQARVSDMLTSQVYAIPMIASVDSKQSILNAMSVLSLALSEQICAVDVNCTALNRHPCVSSIRGRDVCGKCLSGFVSSQYIGNVECLSTEAVISLHRLQSPTTCRSNMDCEPLIQSCNVTTHMCVPVSQSCVHNCFGRGECVFVDLYGNRVPKCVLSSMSCSARCVCTAGYEGMYCSIDSTVSTVSQPFNRNQLLLNVLSLLEDHSSNQWQSSSALSRSFLIIDQLSTFSSEFDSADKEQLMKVLSNVLESWCESKVDTDLVAMSTIIDSIWVSIDIVLDTVSRNSTNDVLRDAQYSRFLLLLFQSIRRLATLRQLSQMANTEWWSLSNVRGSLLMNAVSTNLTVKPNVLDMLSGGKTGALSVYAASQSAYSSAPFVHFVEIDSSALARIVASRTTVDVQKTLLLTDIAVIDSNYASDFDVALAKRGDDSILDRAVNHTTVYYVCQLDENDDLKYISCPESGLRASFHCSGLQTVVSVRCPVPHRICTTMNMSSLTMDDTSSCAVKSESDSSVVCHCSSQRRRRYLQSHADIRRLGSSLTSSDSYSLAVSYVKWYPTMLLSIDSFEPSTVIEAHSRASALYVVLFLICFSVVVVRSSVDFYAKNAYGREKMFFVCMVTSFIHWVKSWSVWQSEKKRRKRERRAKEAAASMSEQAVPVIETIAPLDETDNTLRPHNNRMFSSTVLPLNRTPSAVFSMLCEFFDSTIPKVFLSPRKVFATQVIYELFNHHKYLQMLVYNDFTRGRKYLLHVVLFITNSNILFCLISGLFDMQIPSNTTHCTQHQIQDFCTESRMKFAPYEANCRWVQLTLTVGYCQYHEPPFPALTVILIIVCCMCVMAVLTVLSRFVIISVLGAPRQSSVIPALVTQKDKLQSKQNDLRNIDVLTIEGRSLSTSLRKLLAAAKIRNGQSQGGGDDQTWPKKDSIASRKRRTVWNSIAYSFRSCWSVVGAGAKTKVVTGQSSETNHFHRSTILDSALSQSLHTSCGFVQARSRLKELFLSHTIKANNRVTENSVKSHKVQMPSETDQTLTFLSHFTEQRAICSAISKSHVAAKFEEAILLPEFDKAWGFDVNTENFVMPFALPRISALLRSTAEQAEGQSQSIVNYPEDQGGLMLIHLWLDDLLGSSGKHLTLLKPSPEAQIFKFKRDEDFYRTVYATTTKKFLFAFVVLLVNVLCFYFTLRRARSRSEQYMDSVATASMAAWLLEIFMCESAETVWVNYAIPLLIFDAVSKARRTMHSAARRLATQWGDTSAALPSTGANRSLVDSSLSPPLSLNFSDFFFQSSAIARRFPAVLESACILSYRSPLPTAVSEQWKGLEDRLFFISIVPEHTIALYEKQFRFYTFSVPFSQGSQFLILAWSSSPRCLITFAQRLASSIPVVVHRCLARLLAVLVFFVIVMIFYSMFSADILAFKVVLGIACSAAIVLSIKYLYQCLKNKNKLRTTDGVAPRFVPIREASLELFRLLTNTVTQKRETESKSTSDSECSSEHDPDDSQHDNSDNSDDDHSFTSLHSYSDNDQDQDHDSSSEHSIDLVHGLVFNVKQFIVNSMIDVLLRGGSVTLEDDCGQGGSSEAMVDAAITEENDEESIAHTDHNALMSDPPLFKRETECIESGMAELDQSRQSQLKEYSDLEDTPIQTRSAELVSQRNVSARQVSARWVTQLMSKFIDQSKPQT